MDYTGASWDGLIQQAQLVAAFHAWTGDKSRPLAEYLVALGHLSPAQRAVVEAMAALHLEAHGGDVERSLAAVPAARSTRDAVAVTKAAAELLRLENYSRTHKVERLDVGLP